MIFVLQIGLIIWASHSGTSVVLQHYRVSDECNALEELAPVDMNLNYDSAYQVSNC